jgi:hypothetical protein
MTEVAFPLLLLNSYEGLAKSLLVTPSHPPQPSSFGIMPAMSPRSVRVGFLTTVKENAFPAAVVFASRRIIRSSDVKRFSVISRRSDSDASNMAIAQLACAQILGDLADALLHVIPPQAQRLSIKGNAPDRDVDMRVFRVVVGNRNPIKIFAEILLDALHQVSGQTWQIGTISKLRR